MEAFVAKKKIGITRFLGSNCDYDVWNAIEFIKRTPQWLWYEDKYDPNEFDAIIIPGGFSYGDYLRCGALAARSPVMDSTREAAKRGVPVLGICNGFQILCESGLLPGVLVKNESLRFIDEWVTLDAQLTSGFWSGVALKGETYSLPIAHGEGRFYAEENVLNQLFEQDRILATYALSYNYNGSLKNIAGILNEQKNVCALMPHPERAIDLSCHGEDDGLRFFEVFT